MLEPTTLRTRIYVDSDKDFVRRVIDLVNVYFPEVKRINDIHYDILEALIWAEKEKGSINSPATEVFVKEYIGKPNLTRKLYTKYRRELAKREWLMAEGDKYTLPEIFQAQKLFDKNGLKKVLDIPIMVIRQ